MRPAGFPGELDVVCKMELTLIGLEDWKLEKHQLGMRLLYKFICLLNSQSLHSSLSSGCHVMCGVLRLETFFTLHVLDFRLIDLVKSKTYTYTLFSNLEHCF